MTKKASRSAGKRDAAIAGSAAACVAAAFVLPVAAVEDGPVACPFRLLTGLPCPGCGLARSWVALAHGDLATAFERHAFGPLLFGLALVAIAAVALAAARHAPPVDVARKAASRPSIALAAVWCTAWLVG